MKRKWFAKNSKYLGKTDSVPTFNGNRNELNMQQWLHTIDATGDVFDWDEKARTCMANKLGSNAKSRYNKKERKKRKENLKLSWKESRVNLLGAFASQQGVFSKLEELVNTQREKHQRLVDFYYKKLLSKNCNLKTVSQLTL